MIDLFVMGGPLFMGILTLLLLIILALTVRSFQSDGVGLLKRIKTLGELSLGFGVLGALVGLFSALSTIEDVGNVSQGVLAGGLKVASIAPMYGLIIYIISLVSTLFLSLRR